MSTAPPSCNGSWLCGRWLPTRGAHHRGARWDCRNHSTAQQQTEWRQGACAVVPEKQENTRCDHLLGQLSSPAAARPAPEPPPHLALCIAPGENTPAGLCVLPTQLCSSLPASSGSRGSPHLNKKYCSTRGATLSTRLMRSPSSRGTAGRERHSRVRQRKAAPDVTLVQLRIRPYNTGCVVTQTVLCARSACRAFVGAVTLLC